MVRRESWKVPPGEDYGRDCAGGDGAGEAGDQRGPAGKEPRHRAVGPGKVDVLTTRRGPEGGKPGVTTGPGQRQNTSDNPDAQRGRRAWSQTGDYCRGGENPYADHIGNHQRDRVALAKPAWQTRPFHGRGQRHRLGDQSGSCRLVFEHRHSELFLGRFFWKTFPGPILATSFGSRTPRSPLPD